MSLWAFVQGLLYLLLVYLILLDLLNPRYIFLCHSSFFQYPVSLTPDMSSHTVQLTRSPWFAWFAFIRRLLDLSTARDICDQMNPTISEYSRHHFFTRIDAIIFSDSLVYYPTIMPTKYTIGVEWCHILRQQLRQFVFLFRYCFYRTFSGKYYL